MNYTFQTPTELPDMVTISDRLHLVKHSITSEQAATLLNQEKVENSDLIPGQYEGGFKLWEGGIDLAQFAAQTLFPPPPPSSHFTTTTRPRVMELGCGHGLPGLVALLYGCEVHFQDYNKEVLEQLTIPNAATNWQLQSTTAPKTNSNVNKPPPPARYFSGDWSRLFSLIDTLQLSGTYDIVLSAETVYSIDSVNSLVDCIRKCMKYPGGQAYISGKAYYFGVGGGTRVLVQQASGSDCDGGRRMVAETVATFQDGASNVREIIKLSFAAAGGDDND